MLPFFPALFLNVGAGVRSGHEKRLTAAGDGQLHGSDCLWRPADQGRGVAPRQGPGGSLCSYQDTVCGSK